MEEVENINPEHPWVEASLYGQPRPTEVSAKCEAVILEAGDKKVDVGMLTFLTPVGVFNFYLSASTLGNFTMQCAEVMDQITAGTDQEPGIVIANNAQMKEEAKRAEAARHLRGV